MIHMNTRASQQQSLIVDSKKLHEWFFNNLLEVLNKTIVQLEGMQEFELNTQLKHKLQSLIDHKEQVLLEILQLILTGMLSQLQQFTQQVAFNIQLDDYELLEKALQKSEQEVRTHVRIEQQLTLFNDTLQQKCNQFQLQIDQLNNKLQFCQEKLQQYSIDNVKMKRKIQSYQEKMYEINREYKGQSIQRYSQNSKLVHKNSLHFKQKTKIQPTVRNYSISRPLVSKLKEKQKQKASMIVNFENVFVNTHNLNQNGSLDQIKHRKEYLQIKNKKEETIDYQELKSSLAIRNKVNSRYKGHKLATEPEEKEMKYGSIGL